MFAATERALLLAAARDALEACLENREARPDPRESDGRLGEVLAAFVTLRERETGSLRGCVGTLDAEESVSMCVRRVAVASALRVGWRGLGDPRFEPVAHWELSSLSIHISVLTPRSPVEPADVVVGRHGVVVELDGQSGVLLPAVASERGWGRERFLSETARKAGLEPEAWRSPEAQVYVFEAEELAEDD